MIGEADRLRALLREALDDYADHQSWRCEYPPDYYLVNRPADGYEGCPCGLDEYRKRAEEALA